MDGEIMPEKMTKEEAVVAKTINHLRVVKELIQEEKRETVAYDDESETVKVKRPKKTGEKDTTTIENNTGTHSGYGLAGQESHFKKSSPIEGDSWDAVAQNAEFKAKMGGTSTIPKNVFELFAKEAREYAKSGRIFNQQQVDALIKYTLSMEGLGLTGTKLKKEDKDEAYYFDICEEKLKQLGKGIYSLNKAQLEELSNALSDIVQRIL